MSAEPSKQNATRTADDAAEASSQVSTEAGLRMYAAILGHPPEVDPTAPDPFEAGKRMHLTDFLPHQDEQGTPAHATPTWRQLLNHAAAATDQAAHRLEQARRRLRDRAA